LPKGCKILRQKQKELLKRGMSFDFLGENLQSLLAGYLKNDRLCSGREIFLFLGVMSRLIQYSGGAMLFLWQDCS